MLDGVRVTDLGVSRGDRRLFQNLFLALEGGEAVSLTGGNGTGKTSLLRSLCGFIRPDAGTVEYLENGQAIEPEEARRQHVHMLGHQEGLKPQRTARQEIEFQALYLGGQKSALAEAVEAFQLEPLLDLETRRLSAGQKRRLSLARLVSAPRSLWLLDEPLAPLDKVWRERMGELMQAHLNKGGMIIAAVHDPLPLKTRELGLGGLS